VFRVGELKTTGTDIDKLMPPVSRFGGGNRAAKKQSVMDKLKVFFEKFFDMSDAYPVPQEGQTGKGVTYNFTPSVSEIMVAEKPATYGSRKD
jgi:type I restriction enzyme R subunit